MAAEPAPAVRAPNRALVIILLLVQAVGTIWFLAVSFWAFMAEPADRGTGLWNLSYAIGWFILVGWRVRAMTHPKPA